jgi:hypothetical protein
MLADLTNSPTVNRGTDEQEIIFYSHTKKQDFPLAAWSACCLLHAGLSHGLLCVFEVGGIMFFRNVC